MLANRFTSIAMLAAILSPAIVPAAPPSPPKAIEARPLLVPATRAEAREAQDAAVAAAVIGVISQQFGERAVQVKLDRIQTDPSSLVQSSVEGEGRLLIGNDDEWLPVRFTCLYDVASATASAPQLVVGGDMAGTPLEAHSSMATQLRQEVEARMHAEFSAQPVRFTLDRADELQAGKRYARIEGRGVADFGRDGSTPADIEALYDLRDHAWVRVDYELGSTANRDVIAGG